MARRAFILLAIAVACMFRSNAMVDFSGWFGEFMGKDQEDKKPPHYFTVEVTGDERDLVLAALHRMPATKPLGKLAEKFELARRFDLPLGDGVDWGRLEELARKRGCSVADLWFDNPKGE